MRLFGCILILLIPCVHGAPRRASRCGVSDSAALTDGEGDKWSKTDLTYSLDNYADDMSRDEVRSAIRRSFAAFAAVSPLTFQEVSAGQGDIKIRFVRGQHAGCYNGFDGKGNVLAHAYYPERGDVHFDADENWTVMSASNLPVNTHSDFLDTAMHEIGHALGIRHIDDENSLMYAYTVPRADDRGNYVAPVVDRATKEALQSKYGTGRSGGGGGRGNGGGGRSAEASGRRRVKSVHGTYLRADEPAWKVNFVRGPARAWEEWYIEDWGGKVVLKGRGGPGKPGQFLRALENGRLDLTGANPSNEARALWTPVKNPDGRWSFRSAHGTWLSANSDGVAATAGQQREWETFSFETW